MMGSNPVVAVLTNSGWVLLLLSFLVLIAVPIYRITLHPLARYPGPASWAISRVPWHISVHRGRLHHDLYRMHQKYGQVIRIAPNELSYTDVEAMRDIYVARPGHKLLPRNSVWFKLPKTDQQAAALIVGPDEAGHARLRRGFNSAFTESSVKDMSPVVIKHIDLLWNKWENMIDTVCAEDPKKTGIVVNFIDWLDFTTFDISAELSFGEGFGSIEAGKAHPWVDISRQFGKGVALITSLGFLGPLSKLMTIVMPKDVKEKFIYHRNLTAARVDARLKDEKKSDFIGAVQKHNEDCEVNGHTERMVTRNELYQNMSVIVFAASETTSSGLGSIFRYLLQHPRIMEKLIQEIRTKFERVEDISATNVANLEYLDAVIQEGMRLGPPVVVNSPREIPPGGEMVCEEHLPEGTFVSVASFASFRSPHNFTEPDQFIPERFLSDQKRPGDKMAVFQPFAIGRHMCIGYRLAWLTMRMMLSRILFKFDLRLEKEVGDFGSQKSYLVWEKEPLLVELKKRE